MGSSCVSESFISLLSEFLSEHVPLLYDFLMVARWIDISGMSSAFLLFVASDQVADSNTQVVYLAFVQQVSLNLTILVGGTS